MADTFERVEKHLFKRQYQKEDGEWTTLYYALFRDWKKVQRTVALGAVPLTEARKRLRDLEARNWRHEDFDTTAKQVQAQQMTFARWAEQCLAKTEKRSVDRDRQHIAHLNPFLGDMPLTAITLDSIRDYKNHRREQFIQRYGKPAEGYKVKISTINREIACLRWMLRKATEGGPDKRLLEFVPEIKLESEEHLARERYLEDEEYAALLEASPRWAQRVFICADTTALSRGDLLTLTWPQVNRRVGVINLKKKDGDEAMAGRRKTGARQITPITPELVPVLDELEREFKKLPNTENRVFTRDGKPITVEQLQYAFDSAKEQAEIKDFTFHDFRHSANTRWSERGVPFEVQMVASGHKVPGLHGRYINLQEHHIAAAFARVDVSRKVLTTFKRHFEGDAVVAANLLK